MSALKAKAPEEVKPTKPKMLISGESGVGKTMFALDFPKPYLFDTEGGATREQYQDKLKKSGALVYLVDSTKQSGMGPVQIYPSDTKSDPLYVQAPRAVGESVTVEGFTIRVMASDSSGDTVFVKRN